MRMQRDNDDDVRPRRLFSSNAAGAESGGQPKDVKCFFVDIAVPYWTMRTADGDA